MYKERPKDESDFVPTAESVSPREGPPDQYEVEPWSDGKYPWGYKAVRRRRIRDDSWAGAFLLAVCLVLALFAADLFGGFGRPLSIAWLWGPLLGVAVVWGASYMWWVRTGHGEAADECPHCGAAISTRASRCRQCGSESLYCPDCNQRVVVEARTEPANPSESGARDARYCVNCGKRVSK